LRRIVPSFTVEVRHRPRLPTDSSQGVQSLETKTRPTAFERESHRVTAATFEAKTSNPPSSDGAASHPKRRILESLVPDKPPVGRFQDELLSAATSNPKSCARKPPLVRARKDKEQTSTAPRNSEASSDLKAQMAERPSVASNQPTGMSASDSTAGSSGIPTLTANPVVGDSGGPAPRPKAKRRVQIPLSMPGGPLFPPKTSDPSRKRTPWERSRRTSTTFRVQIESEPSWVAMSSAMN
jgi:hypothetical protein